ncbi:creatininase family protein [Mediterraneibacter sp. NSJ-55]|uniref:Creatininase family protein n=1 Tax=Mediterraneibacter hominis TaxID=2763054 RepID=A0A923LGN1_9FIRM|nr:creatininase family protein [Mediterraneibacter hominis]MBC5687741.1 creatininase family protein [Mediterraneibacter hominis]
MNYYELNQEQAKNYLSRKNMVAILPIGAIEVHGDHLPLDTDCRLAMGVAKKLEERLGIENCAILPCIPYGQVWSLRDVPGSIHIPDEILSAYLYEIAKSLERAGVKQMVVINSHMGNGNAIKTMARRAYESLHIKVYYFTYPRAEKVIQQVCTSQRPHKVLFHADEIETSYMLYLAPEAVDMGKAISQDIEFPEDYEYTSIRWSEFMEKAVLGDAAAASAEKGKRIIDEVIEEIVAVIKGAS